MWRFVPIALLILGFPAWFVWWIDSHHVLFFLYAVFGYVFLMIACAVWAVIKYINQSEMPTR